MEHSFNIYIAEKYGIPSAVLLKNIYFWIEKNRANETNYYDGYYWTYNSKKAFADLFPYLNPRQIDYALKKLIDDGLLITGNYNKVAYDRTLWYAITKKGYSILQNCEMEATKKGNGSPENVQPIPNNNTDCTHTNNNTDIYNSEFDILWKMYPRKQGKPKALKAYIKARKNGTTFAEVEQGIANYCRQIEVKETATEYIKQGATWFNGECWLDEYDFTPKVKYSAVQQQSGNIIDDYRKLDEKILNGELF